METETEIEPARRPEVQIDRRRGLVVCGGRELVLRAKAWEVLLHLAARPDELVSVVELRRGVWRDVTVAAKTVRNVVGELRHALSSSGDGEAIETTKRRGYRLVARVTEIAPRPQPPRGPVVAPPPASPRAEWLPRPELVDQLIAVWRTSLRPSTALALIVGEPGAGKTTLLRWFQQHVEAGDASADNARRPLLVLGCCSDRDSGREPYGPLLMAIGALLSARPAAQALLRRLAPTWLLQFPGLLDASEAERLHALCAGSSPARRSREGVALIEALATEQPLILAIEDLHWADADSLDVLTALTRTAPAVPLLLVATLRRYPGASEADVAARLEGLRRLAGEIVVQPFSGDELQAYLHLRLGTQELPSELVPFLQERSSGNPLVLQSLCRQLIDSGSLQRGALGWQLHDAVAWSGPTLGGDVSSVIAIHLHRLPPALGRVLEAGSLLGEEFSLAALADVLGEPAAAIRLALAELTRQEILRPVGLERFAFTHVVHRQVVRGGIEIARRVALEAAVAAHLVDRPVTPVDGFEPARIASHFAAAGEWARARQYFEYAAHVANSRLDYAGAVRWLETALQCAARGVATADSERHAAHLQQLLGNMMVAQMPVLSSGAAVHFDRAAALFDKHGEAVEAFRARLGFTLSEVVRGYHTSARQGAERLLAMAAPDAPGTVAASCAYAGLVDLFLGRIGAARGLLERSLDAPHSPDLPRLIDLRTLSRLLLATTLAIGGEADAARRLQREALAGYDRDELPATHALTTLLPAVIGTLLRDVALVRTMVEEAAVLADLYVLFRLQPVVAFLRHWVHWRAQRADESLEGMQAALLLHRDSGSRWLVPHLESLLAEAYLERGAIKEARRAVERGASCIEETGEAVCRAELHRLRAQCLLATAGAFAGYTRVGVAEARRWAEQELQRAVAVAREQGATLFERRARAALRQLAASGARPPRAR